MKYGRKERGHEGKKPQTRPNYQWTSMNSGKNGRWHG